MTNGTGTGNLPAAATLTEVIGNQQTAPGVYQTVRVAVEDLAVRLLAGGAMEAAFDRIAGDPSLQQFEGTDDGSTANDTALIAAKSVVGPGGLLRLPYKLTGSYKFGASPDWGGRVIDADWGVEIAETTGMPSTAARFRTPIIYNFGTYRYQVATDYWAPPAERPVMLTEGDIPHETRRGLVPNAGELTYAKLVYPTDDVWAADAADSSDAISATWTVTNNGYARAGFRRAAPGRELKIIWPSGDNYARMAIIRGTHGWQIISSDQAGNTVYTEKTVGGAIVGPIAMTWIGKDDHLTYRVPWAEVTIRVIDQSTWQLAVNGMPVTTKTALGLIDYVGFGIYGVVAGPVSAMCYGWEEVDGGRYGGGEPFVLGVVGDSRMAENHGGASYYAMITADGSLGMRCVGIDNRAIGGQTIREQLDHLNLVGLNGTKKWIVAVGTNNAQGLVGLTTSVNDLTALFDRIEELGGEILLYVLPGLWYSPAQTPGGVHGIPTYNYEAGGIYRRAFAHLCARRGIRVYDTLKAWGPVLGSMQAYDIERVDPVLRDGIHQTTWRYRRDGYDIAGLVADKLAPRLTHVIDRFAWEATWMAGGWVRSATRPPMIARGEDREINADGLLEPGTRADGTIVFRLPVAFHPPAPLEFSPVTSNGTVCTLTVNTEGVGQIFGLNAGVTWISVACLRWRVPK